MDSLSVSSDDALFTDNDRAFTNFQRQQTEKRSCSKKHLCYLLILLLVVCVVLLAALIGVLLDYAKVKKNNSSHSGGNNPPEIAHGFHFFQISDTHLETFYNENISHINKCRYFGEKPYTLVNFTAMFGRVGCDAPLKLLQSATQHMVDVNKKLKSKAKFVIMSGDQMAHGYNDSVVNKSKVLIWSLENSTKTIADSLKLPVIPAIGNNDLYNDYGPPTEEKKMLNFYTTIANVFKPYIFADGSQMTQLNNVTEFEEEFHKGGFYSVNVAEDMMVIVLHTNYWSRGAVWENPDVETIGLRQLEWFSSKLHMASIEKKKVIITGHIPPGTSTYEGTVFWSDIFAQSYYSNVSFYKDSVIVQLFGHVHQDKLTFDKEDDVIGQPIANWNDATYALVCPSISPIFGNNPAYRLYTLDRESKNLIDYAQYFMDLVLSNFHHSATWKMEYAFSHLYGRAPTLRAAYSLIESILSSKRNSEWWSYASHMKASFGGTTSKDRYKEYCAARFGLQYRKCLAYYKDGIMD